MKDVKEINAKELVKAVQDFNVLEIMEPIRIPKRLTEKALTILRDSFVEAIESLTEDEEELLPDNVILMYNSIVEDEVMEEDEDEVGEETEPEIEDSQEKAEQPKEVVQVKHQPMREVESKPGTSKGRPKKKVTRSELATYLEKLIAKGQYTVQELVEMSVKKIGCASVTAKSYIYRGRNPKYNKFSKPVVIENGIVKFVD